MSDCQVTILFSICVFEISFIWLARYWKKFSLFFFYLNILRILLYLLWVPLAIIIRPNKFINSQPSGEVQGTNPNRCVRKITEYFCMLFHLPCEKWHGIEGRFRRQCWHIWELTCYSRTCVDRLQKTHEILHTIVCRQSIIDPPTLRTRSWCYNGCKLR